MRSSFYFSIWTTTVLAFLDKSISFSLSSATTNNGKNANNNNNNVISSIFKGPISQFQRTTLKKQLIKAAEIKDETLVLSLVDELSQFNPTDIPTKGLLGYGYDNGNGNDYDNDNDNRVMKRISEYTGTAPLNGSWKLLYTNAKDAEAPARTEKNNSETFGDEVASGVIVKTGQRINAETGECLNFIQLSEEEEQDEEGGGKNLKKRKRPFDELEITIQMTPLSDKRVRLDFVKGKAFNENAPLPFLKKLEFNFPPPSFGDLLARIRGLDPEVEPQAYFDILYIDEEIRAHRTGEGKIFVQKRD